MPRFPKTVPVASETTLGSYAYHDLLVPQADMLADVLAGLQRPRKEIAPKYFYDARGCELFEAICRLPEYYPTRVELSIMRSHAGAMARALGPDCALIEIGCGNSEKTRLLLQLSRPAAFVPVDIAREQLETSCRVLAAEFPSMAVVAVRADFSLPLALPAASLPRGRRRILYFPGSTIGNFTPEQAQVFLERWAPQLGRGGGALIGVDRKKDPAVLNAAYNDAQAITAEFNLNVLRHINRELGADFNLAGFRHHAAYDPSLGRVEMQLQSLERQRVTVAGHAFDFGVGESINTEISCKYSVEEFQQLARRGGYEPIAHWSDEHDLFSVHYLSVR